MSSTFRRVAAPTAALLLAAGLSACVKTSEDTAASSGTAKTTDLYRDPAAKANLGLPKNPRVVALGWSDGEIALSLGVKPIAIYDWMSLGAKTKGVGSWVSDKFGGTNPKLISAQSAGTFNYQQIKELKPDVILNVRAKKDDKTLTSLRKIAPVVAAPANAPDYAVNWKTQTRIIGSALGKRPAADKLVSQTTSLQQQIKADNPDFQGKTFVWGAMFGEAYGASLAGDARFDTFKDIGFVQNPPVLKLQSAGFFAQVPVEKVKSLDSQVAVFTTIGKPFSELKKDKNLNSLNVVKDGRSVELDEKDPTVVALSAGTPLSLSFALKRITPKLAAATSKVKG